MIETVSRGRARHGRSRTFGAVASLILAVAGGACGCSSTPREPTREEVRAGWSTLARRAVHIDSLLVEDGGTFSFEGRRWTRPELESERERVRREMERLDEAEMRHAESLAAGDRTSAGAARPSGAGGPQGEGER